MNNLSKFYFKSLFKVCALVAADYVSVFLIKQFCSSKENIFGTIYYLLITTRGQGYFSIVLKVDSLAVIQMIRWNYTYKFVNILLKKFLYITISDSS